MGAPETVAVTVNIPAVPFAVNVEEVAMPLSLVMSVSVVLPLAKVPLAPEVGAVKVTISPSVRTPFVVTVAVRGEANGFPFAVVSVVVDAVMPTTSAVPGTVTVDGELELPPQPLKKTSDSHNNDKNP